MDCIEPSAQAEREWVGHVNAVADSMVYPLANSRHVVADGNTHALDQFDRKAMAPFLLSAPFVVAVVGSEDGELVDQVTFERHDLDAVKPGLFGELATTDVIGTPSQN